MEIMTDFFFLMINFHESMSTCWDRTTGSASDSLLTALCYTVEFDTVCLNHTSSIIAFKMACSGGKSLCLIIRLGI